MWRNTDRDAKFALGTACFQRPARAYRIRYQTITPNRRVFVRDAIPWVTTARMGLARFGDEQAVDEINDVLDQHSEGPRPDLDLGEALVTSDDESVKVSVWVRDPSTEPGDPVQVFRVEFLGLQRRGLVGRANRSGTSTEFPMSVDPEGAPWVCTADAHFRRPLAAGLDPTRRLRDGAVKPRDDHLQ